MRMSKLVGRRIKETPRDATTVSHIYLIRGGYVRMVSAGIYSLLPLAYRITAKIEAIIREEMNRIGGQEVLLPVVLPAELWEESGRYQSVGPELLRFTDRNDKQMILGMTHEEAIVALVRTEINSYRQLPALLYQIQTKYRDEARPRAGLIRVREFTMKDAYSFHATQESLEETYRQCHEAYERIFKRVGLKDVISIQSDTGMMGGKVAHEFMAIADCGEDTIFINEDLSYKANREVATSALTFGSDEPAKPLEKVHTPQKESIEEVTEYLDLDPAHAGKAVFFSDADDNLVFTVIRGDFEINETKLRNHLKTAQIKYATDDQIRAAGAVPGFASVLGIDPEKTRIIVDPSARHTPNLIVGANEPDYHYINFNWERDLPPPILDKIEVVDIACAREGDPDPVHHKPLIMKRGIEVGNIFQLGTKYSAAMNCNFLDENGKAKPMIMGCYGIGVGRTMASVIEQSHDDYGPIWPISIAPFHVHICALNKKKKGVGELAEKIYQELLDEGIEVLYDDRDEKAGFAFNDADLIGIPFRIILSPKNRDQGVVEFKTRDGSRKESIPEDEIVPFLVKTVRQALAEYEL
ncbi:MAG: proline--tRNA ligase [Lentisphaerae bacterium]|nr:MAG: proline--tRNA ligase [Lentisphaerota bacterium]